MSRVLDKQALLPNPEIHPPSPPTSRSIPSPTAAAQGRADRRPSAVQRHNPPAANSGRESENVRQRAPPVKRYGSNFPTRRLRRAIASGDEGKGVDDWSTVPLAVWQQHDLAEHSTFAQHLVRAARLFERQPLRDPGLDLA